MPRGYRSNPAYSGYRPKTSGDKSIWAPSGVTPDFFCQLFEKAVLRPMGGRSHTVLECSTRWSRRAGCLFSVIPSSRRAIIAPALGNLALRFGATTVLLPGRSWRVNNGVNSCLDIVESSLRLGFESGRSRRDRGQVWNIDPM